MHYPFWQTQNAQYYRPPQELRRLPFTLLRSHLYPPRPQQVATAARSYTQGAPLPIAYLPQRMAFTRYKTAPWPQAYGTNVRGLLDAIFGARAHWRDIYDGAMQGVPQMPAHAVADPYNRVPIPALDQNMLGQPMGRNSLPTDRIGQGLMDPREQQRLFERENRIAEAGAMVASMRAGEEAQAAADAMVARALVPDPASVPWFMR